MGAPKRDRIQELFAAAVSLEPPLREAFLADACGADDGLRRELISLLDAHERAASFIASSGQEAGETPAPEGRGEPLEQRATRLQRGSRLGAYEVISLLGRGGMGEVYRARDPRLGRDVALKILLPALALDPQRVRRFEQEARAASALNHPAILTVHDIGRHETTLYMVTELIEGPTLRQMLSSGPIPPREVLSIAAQLAAGLAKAHAAGIVHRDLKPENIMVTPDGFAKILDFGLAKLLPASPVDGFLAVEAPALSRTGAVTGTFGYMSPEQARGEPVDFRSDQFSLGLVLYEMATGRVPFEGRSAAERLAALLTETPADIASSNPKAPHGLQRIVERCLAKQAEHRYAATPDLALELQRLRDQAATSQHTLPSEGEPLDPRRNRLQTRLGAGTLALLGLAAAIWIWRSWMPGDGPGRPMIAVLPFENMSGNPALEYLSDGFTEAVLTLLGQRYPRLGVIARTSVMRYKRTDKNAATIARELGVDYLLEGSVRQSADRLRVTAQLIRATDQTNLWSESFDRAGDFLAIQDDVARKVAEAVQPRVDRAAAPQPRPVDPRAHEAYLKGRYFWNKYNEDGWNKAIEYFTQALAIDANYAAAWAGLADSYYQLSSLVLSPAEAIPRARTAAVTALRIDDSDAEAHASLGMIKAQYDWDLPGAKAEFDRAIALNPNYATAHQWLGMYYFADGRFSDARVSFERARQLDPLSMFIAVTAVWPLPHLGQYDEAFRRLEKLGELYPEVPDIPAMLHELRGDRHLQEGRTDAAIEEWLQGFRTRLLCGDGPEVRPALQKAYALHGMRGYLEKQLELAKRKYAADLALAKGRQPAGYVSPYHFAQLHARLGDVEQVFAVLDESLQNRDENLRWLKAESLRTDSPWQTIRPDPRFSEVLRRIGLEP